MMKTAAAAGVPARQTTEPAPAKVIKYERIPTINKKLETIEEEGDVDGQKQRCSKGKSMAGPKNYEAARRSAMAS